MFVSVCTCVLHAAGSASVRTSLHLFVYTWSFEPTAKLERARPARVSIIQGALAKNAITMDEPFYRHERLCERGVAAQKRTQLEKKEDTTHAPCGMFTLTGRMNYPEIVYNTWGAVFAM